MEEMKAKDVNTLLKKIYLDTCVDWSEVAIIADECLTLDGVDEEPEEMQEFLKKNAEWTQANWSYCLDELGRLED